MTAVTNEAHDQASATRDIENPNEAPGGRLIITGHNSGGQSEVTSVGAFPTQVRRPNGLNVIDAWTVDEVPTSMNAESAGVGDTSLRPPTSGVCVRIAVFPPDDAVDEEAAAAYAAESANLYGSDGDDSGSRPGMHRTDTVDVVTVLSGEIWAVLDTGEVLLRPGDVMVQRGTLHAWSNRSTEPCALVTTMIPATRD